jgi:DNA-binding transcriptional ArsR family regulator
MKQSSGFGVFGTGLRTNILVTLSLLEESHASELSRILGSGLTAVRNSLDTLDQVGLIAGRVKGKTRRVRLNPKFWAQAELRTLLDKLALGDPDLLNKVGGLRRRPRRIGKALIPPASNLKRGRARKDILAGEVFINCTGIVEKH